MVTILSVESKHQPAWMDILWIRTSSKLRVERTENLREAAIWKSMTVSLINVNMLNQSIVNWMQKMALSERKLKKDNDVIRIPPQKLA